MSSLLAEKAMIARLSISQWTARKYDKNVSAKVAMDYHANADAGRYNKVLIAKENLQAIRDIVNKTRAFHDENTLPWKDDGARLLPSKNYMTYMQEMRKFKASFEVAVTEFLMRYDDYVLDAKLRMNGLFREADYPQKTIIERKYAFDMHIDPVPYSGDFRVDINSEDVNVIKRDIENRVAAAQEIALKNLWGRLYEVVEKVKEKLSDSDATFRDSLIENVRDVVNILPKLNLFDDPNLERMRQDVESKLCSYSPDSLKGSDSWARHKAATDAQAILDAMGSYMDCYCQPVQKAA